jgi:hypothetical protein
MSVYYVEEKKCDNFRERKGYYIKKKKEKKSVNLRGNEKKIILKKIKTSNSYLAHC